MEMKMFLVLACCLACCCGLLAQAEYPAEPEGCIEQEIKHYEDYYSTMTPELLAYGKLTENYFPKLSMLRDENILRNEKSRTDFLQRLREIPIPNGCEALIKHVQQLDEDPPCEYILSETKSAELSDTLFEANERADAVLRSRMVCENQLHQLSPEQCAQLEIDHYKEYHEKLGKDLQEHVKILDKYFPKASKLMDESAWHNIEKDKEISGILKSTPRPHDCFHLWFHMFEKRSEPACRDFEEQDESRWKEEIGKLLDKNKEAITVLKAKYMCDSQLWMDEKY